MKAFQKSLSRLSWGYLVVGIALMLWPAMLLQVACYAVGAIVLVTGLSSIFSYLKTKDEMFSARVTLVLGIIVSGLGLFLLLQPKTVASILPLIVGLFVFFDGIGRLQTAWSLKKAGYEKWWSMAFPSLVSVGLGVLVVMNPFGTAALMVQVVGLVLTFEGVVNLFTSFYSARIFRNMERAEREMEKALEELAQPENNGTIETDWKEI